MHSRSGRLASRFAWSALHGRCRRRIAAGLILLIVGTVLIALAGHRFGRRGSEALGLDQPLVRFAERLTQTPPGLQNFEPKDDREVYLATVITDQQDVLFGVTVLAFRLIGALTLLGLGLVLLTAGSTEWEIRSETATNP